VLLLLLTAVAGGLLTWATATGGSRSSSTPATHAVLAAPDRARALCKDTFGRTVASAVPATVRELRERRGGPPPVSSTTPLFPTARAADFGAWCWIRTSANTYSAVAVAASGETFTVEVNIVSSSPPTDPPAPP